MASRGENADSVSPMRHFKGPTNENPRHRGRIANYPTAAYNNTLSGKALRFRSEPAAIGPAQTAPTVQVGAIVSPSLRRD